MYALLPQPCNPVVMALEGHDPTVPYGTLKIKIRGYVLPGA